MSDLRETIEAQFDAAESATLAPEAAAPAETAAPVESAESATPAPASDGRPRDASGRFAPKTATAAPKPAEATPTPAPKVAAPTATPTPAPAAQTPTGPELRAPQSWKPEVREKWNALPLEAKQEILRREKEISTTLQESTEARKFREQFEGMLNPYRPLLSQPPMEAIRGLLQTAAQLQTATPAHKAALVAQIVKSYGIPIDALDAALVGEVPQQAQQPQAPQQWRDPRVDMLIQQAAQRQQQQVVETYKAFVQEAPEFFEDVRDTMADIVELEAKRNPQVAPDMKAIYNRACLLVPEVAKVLEQRKAAQTAATATAATQQARAAASSVRSQPAVAVPGNGPKDLRSTLEAAFEAASGRT